MHRFKRFSFLSVVLAAGSAAVFAGCVASAPDGGGTGGTGETGDDTGSAGEGGAGSGNEDSSSGADDGTGAGAGSAGDLAIAAQPWKVLDHQYQAQQTGYWCGPAATRNVLSTVTANLPSQQTLANELPTSTNGTDHIGLVVNTLNKHLGARYGQVLMPNDPPTPGQRDQLWRDIRLSIDAGHGIVANIVAPPSNHPPGYPNSTIYHYIALIGYNAETKQVYVADSANFSNINHYWLSFDQTATLIPPKGYATYRCGVGRTLGDIHARYQAFGGCGGFLGPALTDEQTTPVATTCSSVARSTGRLRRARSKCTARSGTSGPSWAGKQALLAIRSRTKRRRQTMLVGSVSSNMVRSTGRPSPVLTKYVEPFATSTWSRAGNRGRSVIRCQTSTPFRAVADPTSSTAPSRGMLRPTPAPSR
jgi:hypothetical protein